VAAIHLSQAKKKPLIVARLCSLPTKPVFAKIPVSIRLGHGADINRSFPPPVSEIRKRFSVLLIYISRSSTTGMVACSMGKATPGF
jgi:hypothetical protein